MASLARPAQTLTRSSSTSSITLASLRPRPWALALPRFPPPPLLPDLDACQSKKKRRSAEKKSQRRDRYTIDTEFPPRAIAPIDRRDSANGGTWGKRGSGRCGKGWAECRGGRGGQRRHIPVVCVWSLVSPRVRVAPPASTPVASCT